MIAHAHKMSGLRRRQTTNREVLLDRLAMLIERRRLLRCYSFVHGWNETRETERLALVTRQRSTLNRLRVAA
jgi:hypothetical protein